MSESVSSCSEWLPEFCAKIVCMGFAVRVRSAGQTYGPTCHQRDRADVTEFVTLALTAGPIASLYGKRRWWRWLKELPESSSDELLRPSVCVPVNFFGIQGVGLLTACVAGHYVVLD